MSHILVFFLGLACGLLYVGFGPPLRTIFVADWYEDNEMWAIRFLEMAHAVAAWSKDPNTKMGAVIVSDDRRRISVGYNGFPRGVRDDKRLGDRPLKRMLVVHAEANAVYNCPWDPHEIPSTIFVTGQPCVDCAKAIIQSGIKRVIHVEYDFTDHWKESMELAQNMLIEAGVEVIGVEREEAVADGAE